MGLSMSLEVSVKVMVSPMKGVVGVWLKLALGVGGC